MKFHSLITYRDKLNVNFKYYGLPGECPDPARHDISRAASADDILLLPFLSHLTDESSLFSGFLNPPIRTACLAVLDLDRDQQRRLGPVCVNYNLIL